MLRTYLTGLLVWGLSSTGLAQAPQTEEAAENEPAVEFSLGGYYQTRYKSFTNFFEPIGGGQAVANPSIMTHRLKLEPTFAFGDLAKLSLDIDAMNGVLWGDNAGLASTALFAGNPSDTTATGLETDSIALRRAWVEFKVPVGVMRVGRMPSNWGMGLLANDGNGHDDLFGDNQNYTTYDRVLFATRPIAIAQKIMGQEDSEIPLFIAVAYDRLVDDPLATYRGDCRGGIAQGEAGFSARCDEDGDGVTEDLEVTDEGRQASDRDDLWWADSKDDVSEMVYVIVYRGEDIELFGEKGDLTAGSYIVVRSQNETDSNILITDAYIKAHFWNTHLEFEYVNISGDTRALPIPNADKATDQYARTAAIQGYVGRLGYELGDLELWMEHGYASGDGNVFDESFSGRALSPDHNVGLILYDEVLSRVSRYNSLSTTLGSNGGVYNSTYIFPNVRYALNQDWQVIGAFLMAWPDQPDGDTIRCSRDDASARCQENVERASEDDIATASHLGWEVDMALKGKFAGKMGLSLEAGIANITDRIPVAKAGLQADDLMYTVQLRLSYDLSL